MIRAFQWDLARQTERFSWLLQQLPRYAEWGYQELYLHLEDAVEFPRVPGVARADAYSYRQMEQLVAAAGKVGIGVVPIVNLLGHTQYLIKVPELRELNELVGRDGHPLERGQICPLHPRTLAVADRLIADMAPFCTAGKIHVGLDESYHLGKHPLSRAEVAKIGLAAHFARYVQRLHQLIEPRQLRMGLWADMLALLPEAIPLLPRGIIAYDWYYYPFQRHPAMELHNYRPYDLTPALRRQGIEYWGCPMSGPFRFEPMPTFGDRLANLRSWWDRCERVKAEGFLVTAWEPSRVSAPLVQAVDAAAAELWLNPAVRADERMLAAGFRRTVGVLTEPTRPVISKQLVAMVARSMALVALAADRYAYAGYFRWELDEDWAFGIGRGDAAQLRAEQMGLRQLLKRTMYWPDSSVMVRAITGSLVFRTYLTSRDLFVVTGEFDDASKIAFENEFEYAMRAAWMMWDCSRDRPPAAPEGSAPPNVLTVMKDCVRWAASADRGPNAPALSDSLCFQIHNFRPALQKVVLQRRDHSGAWSDVRGRFTIEFTAVGARARAPDLVRPFSVPACGPGTYRLAVRGAGEVEMSGGPLGRKRVRLGAPAPTQGFPPLDWKTNLGESCEFELG